MAIKRYKLELSLNLKVSGLAQSVSQMYLSISQVFIPSTCEILSIDSRLGLRLPRSINEINVLSKPARSERRSWEIPFSSRICLKAM